jgi:hypothetical protein
MQIWMQAVCRDGAEPAPANHGYALGNGHEAIGTAFDDLGGNDRHARLSRASRLDIMMDRCSKPIGKA